LQSKSSYCQAGLEGDAPIADAGNALANEDGGADVEEDQLPRHEQLGERDQKRVPERVRAHAAGEDGEEEQGEEEDMLHCVRGSVHQLVSEDSTTIGHGHNCNIGSQAPISIQQAQAWAPSRACSPGRAKDVLE